MRKILNIAMLPLILTISLLLFSYEAYALPVIDGTTPVIIGVDGNSNGIPDWMAQVHFEVYAPGDGTSPWGSIADYGYYYQVSNLPGSEVPLSNFTIGNPFGAPITSVGPGLLMGGGVAPGDGVHFLPGGTVPVLAYSTGTSVVFAPNPTPPGTHSEVLYITSPWAPAPVVASLQDGGSATNFNLPAPAPEPASLLLLGVGLLGFGIVGRKLMKNSV